MQFLSTKFPGLFIIQPKVFKDSRGFFLENYNQRVFDDNGLAYRFVQDNHARSESKNVLRGLHFQLPPAAQTKLVRVIKGAVFDVVADLRKGSPTYLQWFSIELTESNFTQLLIPRGFAHGYLTLAEGTEFEYKVDAFYEPGLERGIKYDDPDLNIQWPSEDPLLSEKDKNLDRFSRQSFPFTFSE